MFIIFLQTSEWPGWLFTILNFKVDFFVEKFSTNSVSVERLNGFQQKTPPKFVQLKN